MADRWFYAADDNKIGPFSGQQLRDLADKGHVLATDTIWKEGVVKGVSANKVKNLFQACQPEVPPVFSSVPAATMPSSSQPMVGAPTGLATVSDDPLTGTLPDKIELQPEMLAPLPQKPTRVPEPVKKRRAVAKKGAIIVSQDGVYVKFKRKCTVCDFEESSWHTMQITIGTMKSPFFCPKCRKRRDVEMQGSPI